MINTTFKILQFNVGRRRVSHDLLYATATRENSDLLIVSEPNEATTRGWIKDEREDAAIKIINQKYAVRDTGKGQGYVWVRIRNWKIYSCYFSPNRQIEEYELYLMDLQRSVRDIKRGEKVIVAGDFNSKAVEWGSPNTNSRGEMLLEWAAGLDIFIENTGNTPTFTRDESNSIIDLTWATSGVVKNWKVMEEEEMLSLHNCISFELIEITTTRQQNVKGWAINKLNEEIMQQQIAEGMESNPTTEEELEAILIDVCNSSMPKKVTTKHKPVYWWTEEIALLRRTAIAARRQFQRKRRRNEGECQEEREELRQAKKILRKAIEKSQKLCWKILIDDIDNDVWGEGYKIATKRLKVREYPQILSKQGLIETTTVLFPKHRIVNWILPTINEDEIPIFTETELINAAQRMKSKRAPGPDNIPPEILKATVKQQPDGVLKIMNKLLKEGIFPQKWKIARLVLIKKINKSIGNPSSYRPLCMLNTIGKLYEKLIHSRLKVELEENEGLSNNQYGFREGRSTEGALNRVMDIVKKATEGNWRKKKICVLVTFDIKNAFNTAPWREIIRELKKRGISTYLLKLIMSYLNNRFILAENEEGVEKIQITAGVPQGSVLGPLLWNVLYDGILRIKIPNEATMIAYADDLALIVSAYTTDIVQKIVSKTINKIKNWITCMGLELSIDKTEAIILAGNRRVKEMKFKIGEGYEIKTIKTCKYLGVTLETGGGFRSHIKQAAKKASIMTSYLGRLMPNVGGPKSSRRKLLGKVTQSIMLYAAPIWCNSLNAEWNRKILGAVQRKAALRICSGYRTISEDAALVIAGIPPIDILAKSRKLNIVITKQERERQVYTAWQNRWDNSKNGDWTRRLIPNIEIWIKRKHGEIGYYLTQAFTGHGSFRSYLYKFRRVDDEICKQCGNFMDTAEHTIFYCNKWDLDRRTVQSELNIIITPENLIDSMLINNDNWNILENFIIKIITDKEIEEEN